MNLAALEAMAQNALPQSEDDYASDRQVDAENRFFEELASRYPVTFSEDGDGEFHLWALKATSEEYINYAIQLVREGKAK